MKQSRTMSLIEAIANVAVGFWVAVAAQTLVFPLFGFHAAPTQHLAIGAIFTGLALIRSFALRRLFEAFLGGLWGEMRAQENHQLYCRSASAK